jgi:hypothetical protein
MVYKGEEPCTWCVYLAKTEADPAFHLVATQQWNSQAVRQRGEDVALASLAGAFAAAQTVSALAGETATTSHRSVKFSLPGFEQTWTDHVVHPKCKFHASQPVGRAPKVGPWPPAREMAA